MEDLEEWKPVVGLEGRYEVSTLGRIRSLPSRTGKGKIRKLPFDRGYRRFGWQDRETGKIVSELVHVTVARAFLGPRPVGSVIRHIDGDGLNNMLTNITYGSQSENIRDSVRHGTHAQSSKTHCPQGHEYSELNTRRDGNGWRKCKACGQ